MTHNNANYNDKEDDYKCITQGSWGTKGTEYMAMKFSSDVEEHM